MPSTFYETNCDLVLVKDEGGMLGLDSSGVKQRFLLHLNMSYSGVLGSMTAFRADLRDAVALAFQVRLAFLGRFGPKGETGLQIFAWPSVRPWGYSALEWAQKIARVIGLVSVLVMS